MQIQTHDEEPSEDLLDLYYYKMEQLQEITHRVYNSDDVKRLSSKLAKEQRGQIGVRIFGVKRMIFNCVIPIDLSGECLLNTFFGFRCKIDKNNHVPRYCQIRGELLRGYSTEETTRGLHCFSQKEV